MDVETEQRWPVEINGNGNVARLRGVVTGEIVRSVVPALETEGVRDSVAA